MLTSDKLVWGAPCRRNGHQTEDGTNLRHAWSNRCMMCDKGHLQDFRDQLELLEFLINPPPKKTKEEKAAGAVAASMRWNARNKDKVKEYTSKYSKKPERRAAARQKYAKMTDEQKQAVVERQRMRREEKRANNPKPDKTTLTAQEKRERHNARMRASYAAMTQEERDAQYEKTKARRALKDKDGS